MVMAPTACVPAEVCITKPFDKDCYFNNNLHLSNHGEDDLSQSRLAAKDLVLNVLKKRAAEVNTDLCGPGEEDAFYVADMGEVYRQHLRWKMNLSRVRPFYGKPSHSLGVMD
jgi:ornithine decarboxylase